MIVERWSVVVLQLSANLVQSILASGGGLRDSGLVGPSASSGVGRFRSLEVFNASLRILAGPTSSLRTATIIR